MKFDFNLDPFLHFQREFSEAENSLSKDPNAMSLATVNKQGIPSNRTVLFKGVVRGGFSFYTNYHGHKSQDLNENNHAALLFYWPSLNKQIRIQGRVFALTREESEAYFSIRPRLSQIGAWASNQSEEIASIEFLERKVKAYEQKFQGSDVPCPPHWGGWHVIPLQIEFWFAKEGRLHERYVYERNNITDATWKTCMKAP